LAGDVVLGATAVAEAVRRIGLGEALRSGRARIDVGGRLDRLDEPEMKANNSLPEQYSDPALPGVSGLVTAAAIRAPSGGNAQPWHIETTPDAVTIRLAPQHTSMMDVGFRGSAVAVGAALFNARVSAARQQMLGPVTLREGADCTQLAATLDLRAGTDPVLAALYEPMLARETNRRLGVSRPIAADTIEALAAAARREGGRLHLVTQRDDIERAATIFAATDRIRYLTPRLHAQMVSELRWPGDDDSDTGIDVNSLELEASALAVLDILRRPDVMNHLAQWKGGSALGEDTRRHVSAGSAIAVISVTEGALADYARGGAAVEAVWIAAQQRGLAVQPYSPVFLYAQDANDLTELSVSFAEELGDLQQEFRKLACLPADAVPALVLRLTVSEPASVRSRRSLERVRLLVR
jgi:nitroreductase